uniref:Uncharacterized protein n=1 Tax=Cacopsylla melanoneura TaxID=428564 RepID=A0A8D8ZZ33_9HEMI
MFGINMEARVLSSVLILLLWQSVSKVTSLPLVEKQPDAEGDMEQKPVDLFRVQEEAKVLLERDPKLKPQFVAIIHNKFPHPTFPGQRSPWFQVYVYSDYFKGMPMDERKKNVQFVISEKLFEAGFHRVSYNCLTLEEEKNFDKYRPPEDQLGGPTPIPSAESEYEGPMMKKYKAVLQKNFKLHHIEIIDTSDNYHQPANSEMFLTIMMVSDEFKGKTEYEREQMVINALKKDMPWDVRGLALINMTPEEYKKQERGETTPEVVQYPHPDTWLHMLKNSTHYLCQPPYFKV